MTPIQELIKCIKEINVVTPALNKVHAKALSLIEKEEKALQNAFENGAMHTIYPNQYPDFDTYYTTLNK